MSDESVLDQDAERADNGSVPEAQQDEPESVAATGPQGDGVWPTRRYHQGRLSHVANAFASVLARAGVMPHTYLLTTQGRKTGRPRSNPVVLVQHGGQRWLVAPYGPVSWVLNARAAGKVELARRGSVRAYTVREVPPQQAGAVLKEYVRKAPITLPYFRARPDSPAQDFTAEAALHPVFELVAPDQD